MTWSLQLSFWALPPLLAVLVILRDIEYLWPRRREAGARALMVAAVLGGLWAMLALISVITPTWHAKALIERVQYVPGALAPLAWVAFSHTYAARPRELRRWKAALLYLATLATLVIVLRGDPNGLLVRGTRLVDIGGMVGLQVAHGPWHWVHVGLRAACVAWVVLVLTAHLVRTHSRVAVLWVLLGASLALLPSLLQWTAVPGAAWADQTPAGFALGSSVLVFGLLRRRLLDLGPVARTLVMDELRDPIIVLDAKGRIVDANRAAERTLGLHPYGDVPLDLGTFWASSRQEVVPSTMMELEVTSGSARTFEVTVSRMRGDGRQGHSALLLLDITERERMRRELKRLANTDDLTTLANRRRFMEALQQEIERAQRYDRPLALVLLDLDHFKQVNDTHGHAAGDQVLRSAAAALRGVCRDVDIAARIGGEELALLLPETALQGANAVAERVRARIQDEHHRAPSGATFRVTGSIGVASLGRGASTGEALLQAADEALYRAKAEGRNRVVTAD